ncbi:MAG: hypothetical protein ACRDRJ_08575 [Streptosporangiaceae bacterium]
MSERQVRPVGAENLCHQVIFVNHASCAITPLDPELIQFGDAVGQRAERRGLAERAVPVGVAEILVLVKDGHQVPLIPDQGPVQQLTAAGADPAFHDRIQPRRLNGGAGNPDASGPEDLIERGGEAGVPVVQDELCPRPGGFEVHQQIPGLLPNPRLGAMGVLVATALAYFASKGKANDFGLGGIVES